MSDIDPPFFSVDGTPNYISTTGDNVDLLLTQVELTITSETLARARQFLPRHPSSTLQVDRSVS